MHHKMQYTLNYFINCGDLLESFVSIKKKKSAVIMNDINGKYIPFISYRVVKELCVI